MYYVYSYYSSYSDHGTSTLYAHLRADCQDYISYLLLCVLIIMPNMQKETVRIVSQAHFCVMVMKSATFKLGFTCIQLQRLEIVRTQVQFPIKESL